MQRGHIDENRDFSLQLYVVEDWLSERSAANSGVPKSPSDCKIQTARDRLQTVGFCLVTRALPHHIISPMVTLARLNLPQIARKAKPPPHEAEVKSRFSSIGAL